MPITKTIATVISPVTVAADSRSDPSSTVNLLSTIAVMLSVTLAATFATDADGAAMVELYSSLDDSVYDTQPFFVGTIEGDVAGGDKQETWDVACSAAYVKARVKNGCSATDLTGVQVDFVKTCVS